MLRIPMWKQVILMKVFILCSCCSIFVLLFSVVTLLWWKPSELIFLFEWGATFAMFLHLCLTNNMSLSLVFRTQLTDNWLFSLLYILITIMAINKPWKCTTNEMNQNLVFNHWSFEPVDTSFASVSWKVC